MQIRLLTSLAGPDGAWAAGDLFTCDEATAGRMIAAGYAVPAFIGAASVVVETADAPPFAERAIVSRKGKRT